MHIKKFLIYIIIVIILAAAGGAYYFVKKRNSQKTQNPVSTQTVTTTPGDQSTTTSPATNPTPAETPASTLTLVYPLSNFVARITQNDFGKYYPVGGTTNPDRAVCPNATYYVGYHTANDLETFPDELNIAVSIKSIADGTVREVSPVSGYGGLIVIEYNLGGSTYTAYFGHINLATATVKAGDHVKAGQYIVDLGPQCSGTNGDVRKHLHFGLHKGTAIDVRGYVPDQTTLSNWVDPKILLSSLGAQ
jgi:murein DD-endopeptidase MepM/ murein hydrolase activator NlpD